MRRMLVAVICAVGVVGVPAVVLSAEATAASKPAATHVLRWPVIKRGARGPRVRVVQFLLNAHGAGVGVNAKFGPHTVLAVKAFQLVQGLKPSGQVNAATWTKLIIKVQRGSRGPAVRAVQRQLRSAPSSGTSESGWMPGSARRRKPPSRASRGRRISTLTASSAPPRGRHL